MKADTMSEAVQAAEKDLDEATRRITAARKRLNTVDRRYRAYQQGKPV